MVSVDVRHQLCYVSSFMLLNIAQSATGEMATRNKELLEKWRDTLAKHSQKWAPARLAAGKLESQLSRGLDCLVAGPISSSPVGMLMKEEV